ncbi:MAG: Eco57I restriction-modification methylase domain-containing protein [Chromatiaceae bacterium]|nr:Eco57I restriction-modification methylase domain-containing protein [Chromatiaceae bacterium]
MLREFIDQQFQAHERTAFAFLFERVFDRMTLAGEAGSLLRIEDEIRDAVVEARALAETRSAPRQLQLLPGDAIPEQARLDLSGLTDDAFWRAAEARIYDALRAYAEQAENGSGFRRRLFADDAAQGFAFIDLCRKRYDVVVMNPPYGDPSECGRRYLSSAYSNLYSEIYLCFFNAALRLAPTGLVGALTSRTWMNLSKQFVNFRKDLIKRRAIDLLAELGAGVLDKAAVETSASVLTASPANAQPALFIDCSGKEEDGRSEALVEALRSINDHALNSITACHSHNHFTKFPSSAILHGAGDRGGTSVFNKANKAARFVAKQGLGTSDDFRFIRLRWEIPVGLAMKDGWAVVIIGDQPSRFYAEHSGVLKWFSNGKELKTCITDKFGSATRTMLNASAYFNSGLTYQYTGKHFRVYPLPKDSLITMAGQGLYPNDSKDAIPLLALLNTDFVTGLLKTINPGRFFQSGHVNSLPSPSDWLKYRAELNALGRELLSLWEALYEYEETSYRFLISRLTGGISESVQMTTKILAAIETKAATLENVCAHAFLSAAAYNGDRYSVVEVERAVYASRVFSACLGAAYGRWDIRYANGERLAPDLPDPFAPLPVCPPGMLQGEDGLPLSPEEGRRQRAEGRYPLDIAWDGILVDDPEHPLDIERRVHDALAVIWGDQADAIQQEACELLGVPTLREWFCRPAGFFADHLKRYSKSRRQAPIYWPLSSPGGRYTVWLYYHCFSKDTLYRALEQVQEKLDYEERKLSRLTPDAGGIQGATDRAALADQESFVTELRTFREELTRVAPLWNPNLNDGVILNYGPLWRMIGHKPWQKDVKAKWDELIAGKYDWAHLAMHLWPERVVPKCAKDRSLAIAHDLESVFWEENDNGKWRERVQGAGFRVQEVIDQLIAERTSAAVKDALQNLLDAPAPAAGRSGGRRTSGRSSARRTQSATGRQRSNASTPPDPAVIDAIKQAIDATGAGASKADVLAATGLSDAQWTGAIAVLLAEGSVTKSGAGRGTRYHRLNPEA